MDTRLQRLGGIGALGQIGALLAEVLFFAVYLPSLGFSINDMTGGPQSQVRLASGARTGLLILALVLFLLFSLTFVTVHALYVRLRSSAPSLSLLAAIFGYASSGLLVLEQVRFFTLAKTVGIMFSSDQMVYLSPVFDAMREFLENGAYLLIVPWMLLVSVTALRNRELPRPVAYLGIVVAGATLIGVVGIAPQLEFLPDTLWLLSVGVVLLVRPDPKRTPTTQSIAEPASA